MTATPWPIAGLVALALVVAVPVRAAGPPPDCTAWIEAREKYGEELARAQQAIGPRLRHLSQAFADLMAERNRRLKAPRPDPAAVAQIEADMDRVWDLLRDQIAGIEKVTLGWCDMVAKAEAIGCTATGSAATCRRDIGAMLERLRASGMANLEHGDWREKLPPR